MQLIEMGWILLIVSIALTIIKVLFGHKVGDSASRRENYDKIIRKIKEDSEAIHFTFEECTFTQLDTSKRRRKKDSKQTFLGVSRKGEWEDVKNSNTKVTCRKLNAKKEFISTFPIDLEIAKTKTLENKGVTVYVEKEDSYIDFEEEYYMDLNFLYT